MKEESFGTILFRNSEHEKEVLLVRKDYWGFPKGHRNEGEDGRSAALRETKEETGIVPAISLPERALKEQYLIENNGNRIEKTVLYWIGTGEGIPVPDTMETESARWVPVSEALKLLSYESARVLLRESLSDIHA